MLMHAHMGCLAKLNAPSVMSSWLSRRGAGNLPRQIYSFDSFFVISLSYVILLGDKTGSSSNLGVQQKQFSQVARHSRAEAVAQALLACHDQRQACDCQRHAAHPHKCLRKVASLELFTWHSDLSSRTSEAETCAFAQTICKCCVILVRNAKPQGNPCTSAHTASKRCAFPPTICAYPPAICMQCRASRGAGGKKSSSSSSACATNHSSPRLPSCSVSDSSFSSGCTSSCCALDLKKSSKRTPPLAGCSGRRGPPAELQSGKALHVSLL